MRRVRGNGVTAPGNPQFVMSNLLIFAATSELFPVEGCELIAFCLPVHSAGTLA